MARGYVTGLLWGVIVVGGGLVTLSQLAPPVAAGKAVEVAGGVGAVEPVAGESVAAEVSGAEPGVRAEPMAELAEPVTGDGASSEPVAAEVSGVELGVGAEPAEPVAGEGAASEPVAAEVSGTEPGVVPTDRVASEPAATVEPKGMRVDVVESGVPPGTAGPVPQDQGGDGAKVEGALNSAADPVLAESAGDAAVILPSADMALPGAGTPAATAVAGLPDRAVAGDAAAPEVIAGAPAAGTEPAATVAEAAPVTSAADDAVPELAEPGSAVPPAQDIGVAKVEAPQPEAPVQEVGVTLAEALPAPLPDRPAEPDLPPTLSGLEPALTAPGAEAGPVAGAPLPPEPEGVADALLAPALPPGQTEPARLPQIAEAEAPGIVAEAPVPVPAPEAEMPPQDNQPIPIQAQPATILPPVKSLTDKVPTGLGHDVPGVEVNTLPQIGGAPQLGVAAPPAEERPVARYARAFEAAAGRPLFVILLHDVGSAGMNREDLARLPFPVSFVIDPLATDAKAAEAAYRAAGQEVLVLANGIPPGAVAGDLAETFQALSGILPQSVALIDQDLGGFQDDRPLATMVLPILQDEGRGLVTYDRGLNAADQIARRDGVPSAVIFRRLDGEGESKQTIRRYLDRAAFKAAQEGQVVVIGDTRADTVAAILEWTVEGRAASVTLAPVTAVLGRR